MGRLSSLFRRGSHEQGSHIPIHDSSDHVSTIDAPLISDQTQTTYEIALEAMFSTNLLIKRIPPEGHAVLAYWVKVSEWKSLPDLVFHEGEKEGPIVGSAVMRKRNHEMTLKVGGTGTLDDHSASNGLATVNKDNKWHDNVYTLTIPATSTRGPRTYHFTRTQSTKDGVHGIAAKLAYYNWNIHNVRRERVGLYLESAKGLSLTRGKLTLYPDTLDDPDDLFVVLLGLDAITERVTRDVNLIVAVS
jgi:hypothetical protein